MTKNKTLIIEHSKMYAPQLVGSCAYVMSDTSWTAPDAFVIHHVKLYLKYSKSVQKVRVEDKFTNIKEADYF
jgi:hypothetical protein